MKAGTTFYIILDRPSGKVKWPVTLSGTSDDASARQILFTIANQPVGSGDSGSLIIDRDGNSVGAFDVGTTSTLFTATAIEDEQAILLSGPVAKKPATTSGVPTDGLRRTIRGVSPYLWGIISKDSRSPLSKLFTLDTTSPKKAAVGKAPLPAGSMYSSTIFMVSSYGDAVSAYTYGSVTTPYLGKLICYGHSLNWEGGSQDIPCYFGTVTNFVVDPIYGGEKVGNPDMSRSAGTLVDDRRFGVVVDPTVTATPIPITGTVTVNTNQAVTFHGFVAQDPLMETTLALTNITQGTSNIVDANEVGGSATGSATINFADGTSQTVDLTDSGSSTLIADLYDNIGQYLYDQSTFAPLLLSSITFSFVITTT